MVAAAHGGLRGRRRMAMAARGGGGAWPWLLGAEGRAGPQRLGAEVAHGCGCSGRSVRKVARGYDGLGRRRWTVVARDAQTWSGAATFFTCRYDLSHLRPLHISSSGSGSHSSSLLAY